MQCDKALIDVTFGVAERDIDPDRTSSQTTVKICCGSHFGVKDGWMEMMAAKYDFMLFEQCGNECICYCHKLPAGKQLKKAEYVIGCQDDDENNN